MRRTRLYLAIVAVVAVASFCAAASWPRVENSFSTSASDPNSGNLDIVESHDRPHPGGRLAYGIADEQNGWNPAINEWSTSGIEVAKTLFDTLTAFDDNSQVHPFLLESYTPNSDFTAWTLRLRPGITLSNGKAVTAETIVRNQEAYRNSPVTGPAYYRVQSFQAVDPLTVLVRLTSPWSSYPLMLTSQVGVVADPDWLASYNGLDPIGTGPFTLSRWNIDHDLTVVRNPNYWRLDSYGQRFPYLDVIEFRVMPDSAAREKALAAGDVDAIESSDPAQLQSFQDPNRRRDYQVFADPKANAGKYLAMLNTMAAPFDDQNARLALAYATDQQAFIRDTDAGDAQPVDSPISPGSKWYVNSGYPRYDPDRARALVAQVKQKHNGKFSFTIRGWPDAISRIQLKVLEQQWEAVGIDVKVEIDENDKMMIWAVTGNYQATLWYQFDAPDPAIDSTWFNPSLAKKPPDWSLNFARVTDPPISSAISDLMSTTDDRQQKTAWGMIQLRLGSLCPYIWLYQVKSGVIARKQVVNVTKWTLPDGAPGLDLGGGAHPLHQVWLRLSPS
jgi:peptide/nickel transport system substrate-binding protein